MNILVTEQHSETRAKVNHLLRDMETTLNVTVRSHNSPDGTQWMVTGLDDGTEHIFFLFRTGEFFEIINTPDGKTWCGPMTVDQLENTNLS